MVNSVHHWFFNACIPNCNLFSYLWYTFYLVINGN